ncbi:MAG: DUF4922 domain-containing protein [Candidatus Azobacteroides sp.]|nr:DUF4922 domain-containing protein [Candidatus Azobacteroides sp.]
MKKVLKDFSEKNIENIFEQQLKRWPFAGNKYRELEHVQRKILMIDDHEVTIQYNPARIASASAKTDEKGIKERPCFLCEKNLPPEQDVYILNENFFFLVNPYPIFKPHFTIPHRKHIPQQILLCFNDLLLFTRQLKDFTIFYNGAKCGASAPDHLHFQACRKNILPAEKEINKLKKNNKIYQEKGYQYVKSSLYSIFLIEEEKEEDVISSLKEIFSHLPYNGDIEPMINLLAVYENNTYRLFIFPRKKHRPDQYFKSGKKQLLISPGAVDMGGILVVPRKEDFDKITKRDVLDIFKQISLFIE